MLYSHTNDIPIVLTLCGRSDYFSNSMLSPRKEIIYLHSLFCDFQFLAIGGVYFSPSVRVGHVTHFGPQDVTDEMYAHVCADALNVLLQIGLAACTPGFCRETSMFQLENCSSSHRVTRQCKPEVSIAVESSDAKQNLQKVCSLCTE